MNLPAQQAIKQTEDITITFKATFPASYFDYGVPYGEAAALAAAVARDMRTANSEELLDDLYGREVEIITVVLEEVGG